jgi:hypothetical protein
MLELVDALSYLAIAGPELRTTRLQLGDALR